MSSIVLIGGELEIDGADTTIPVTIEQINGSQVEEYHIELNDKEMVETFDKLVEECAGMEFGHDEWGSIDIEDIVIYNGKLPPIEPYTDEAKRELLQKIADALIDRSDIVDNYYDHLYD